MQLFTTLLSGREETPPVMTAGSGNAQVLVNDSQSALFTRLNVANLRNIILAHIHLGRPGVAGPIVVLLLDTRAMPFNVGPLRPIVNRMSTSADLIGPLAGMPLSALVAQMRAGNTYINVHTTQFPDGEIRGQLMPSVLGRISATPSYP